MKIDAMKIDVMKIGEMKIRETILDAVARREGQVFLVDASTGREITYGEFHRLACALARGTPSPRRAEGRPHRCHGPELL